MNYQRYGIGDNGTTVDTWSREAWQVMLLAAELDMVLDDETLILSDVYDLRVLSARLYQRLIGHSPRGGRVGRALAWIRRAGRTARSSRYISQ